MAAACPCSINTVIFDCDGVLVDTEGLKHQAWQETLKPYKISFSLDEYLPLVGHSSQHILNSIIKAKGVNLPFQKVIDDKNRAYKRIQATSVVPIHEGVHLAKLLSSRKKELNIKLALASSAPRSEIMHNLKTIGLEHAFDKIISGDDDLKDIQDSEGTNKPKPYIYLRLAEWLQVGAEHCLVIEDTEAGVTAAHTAGMDVIAVPNRFTKGQNFAGALLVVDSLSDPAVQALLKL